MYDELQMNRISPDGTAWNGDVGWMFIPLVSYIIFIMLFIGSILAK